MSTPTLFIREWRLARGLSQEELAIHTRHKQESISQIESGSRNPTLRTLQRIAEGLGVAMSQFHERPPTFTQSLNRFHIDRVARSVVYGKPLQNQLVRDIAGLASEKLKTHGAPGRNLVRGIRWNTKGRSIRVRHQYGDTFVRAVLTRIDKFL